MDIRMALNVLCILTLTAIIKSSAVSPPLSPLHSYMRSNGGRGVRLEGSSFHHGMKTSISTGFDANNIVKELSDNTIDSTTTTTTATTTTVQPTTVQPTTAQPTTAQPTTDAATALDGNQVLDHLMHAYLDLKGRNISKEDAPLVNQLRKNYLIHLSRRTRALGDDVRGLADKLNVTIANITSEIGDGIMEVGRDVGEGVVRLGVGIGGGVAQVGGDLVNASEAIYNAVAHPKGDVVDTVVQVTKEVANGLRRVTSDVENSVERIGTDIADTSARLFNTIVSRFGRLETLFNSGISSLTSGYNQVKDSVNTLDSRVRRSADTNRVRTLPLDGYSGLQEQLPQLYNDQGEYIAHKAPSQDYNDNGRQQRQQLQQRQQNAPLYSSGRHLMIRGAGGMYQPQQAPPPPPIPIQPNTPRDDPYQIRNGMNTVTVHVETMFGVEVETSYSVRLTHIPGFHYVGHGWTAEAQRKYGTRKSNRDNDERGHVIARVLGGPSERWNLQPQTWSMNHGYGEPLNWRIVENHVVAWLQNSGQSVDWLLELDYLNGGPRPSQYRLLVTYYITQQGVEIPDHTEFIACPNVLYADCVTQ
jgi:hypothetical protein